MTMLGTDLLAVAVYLAVMTPGIETVWEFLMSGFGVVLWLAVVFTAYRLLRWGYRSVKGKPAGKS